MNNSIPRPTAPIWVGISGGSGAIYAQFLVKKIIAEYGAVDLTITDTGLVVLKHELRVKGSLEAPPWETIWGEDSAKIKYYKNTNLFAPMATGSRYYRAGVIIPCSMGTMGKIASGISDTLVTRSADVLLKERRKLILVPRESPYSDIHLENMLRVTRAGAIVLPASPGFYKHPETVEDCVNFIVDRIMSHL